MGKLGVILCFLIYAHCSIAQNKVSGEIVDELDQGVSGASVILIDSLGKIEAYTYSKKTGHFSLENVKNGHYILEISSLGYVKGILNIILPFDSFGFEPKIYLERAEIELETIEIKYTLPIRESGDSIIYNADSFMQGNEQVLEDLLKKMPGINVDSDGTIKFYNKEIENLMIDGDDIFGKSYQILSKNMPPNPVDKVEVLRKYSKNKHLKGIENSDKVSMNIRLKDDYRREWFGNLQYGLGNNSKLEARSNLMNFGGKSKYYALGTFNNTGISPVGDIKNLTRTSGTSSKPGNDISAYQMLSLKQTSPNLSPERVNLNKSGLISINGIFNLSEKSKLKLIGLLNNEKDELFKNQLQSYSIGAERFDNFEDFQGTIIQQVGLGQINFTYDLNSNQTLEYVAKINGGISSDNSTVDFNNYQLIESIKSNQTLFDQQMTFTKQIKEKQVIMLDIKNSNDRIPQNYEVNQSVFNELFGINATNLNQFSRSHVHYLGGELSYLKRSNYLLELKLGNQLRIDNFNTRLALDDGDHIRYPGDYENDMNYITNDLYILSKVNFKYNQVDFNGGLELHNIRNSYSNLTEKKSQNPLYLNPSIGFKWEANKRNKLSVNYAYNNTNLKVTDIYDNYILTGFKNLTAGLGDFTTLNYSNFAINHSFGKFTDKFNVNTILLYNKFYNSLTTNSVVSPNFTQSQKITIRDREMLSAVSNLNYFIQPIQSNLRLNLAYNQLNFKNIVNGSGVREVVSHNFNYGLEARSGYSGRFNFHIGLELKSNKVSSDLFKQSFTDNSSFVDLLYVHNARLNFSIQGERYYFAKINQQAYYFLDFESKYILIDNKLNLFLLANNLFNNSSFNTFSITDISNLQTEYRLQPRYIMLKIEWRF